MNGLKCLIRKLCPGLKCFVKKYLAQYPHPVDEGYSVCCFNRLFTMSFLTSPCDGASVNLICLTSKWIPCSWSEAPATQDFNIQMQCGAQGELWPAK